MCETPPGRKAKERVSVLLPKAFKSYVSPRKVIKTRVLEFPSKFSLLKVLKSEQFDLRSLLLVLLLLLATTLL